MADFTDHITPAHEAMIGRQAVFFVARAAAEARTRSIDGLPVRPTDRYIGGA